MELRHDLECFFNEQSKKKKLFKRKVSGTNKLHASTFIHPHEHADQVSRAAKDRRGAH